MIKTKDLVGFMNNPMVMFWEQGLSREMAIEYKREIVARLRAFDKLKESIEKMIATLSSGVDRR